MNTGHPPRSASLPASTPAERAFRALIRAFGLLKRIMEPYFAQHGISGAQWGVLRTLHRAETEGVRGLRLTDLSDRLLIRPPSVTGVVDRLERQGLVARATAAEDQRVKHVSLTTAGRRLLDEALEGHGHQIQSLMSKLSAPEQAQLHRLLERLGTHFESLAESQGIRVEPDDTGKDE